MKQIKLIVFIFLSFAFVINNWYFNFGIKEVSAATATPPNFKVAFIGDTGDGSNFQAVLNLIKAEGTNMVLHAGDFSYSGLSPWNTMINSTLGSNFPYFGSAGNHDSWSTYWPFFSSHITGSGATILDNGSGSDKEYALKYGGITMAFVGDGGSSSWDAYASFVNNQLSASDSIWKICNWHRTGVKDHTTSPGPRAMTSTGEKPYEMGTQVYETCRQLGAIISQAHEHSYSRTKTITRFVEKTSTGGALQTNNSISPDTIDLKPGSTFVLTSGLGGHSARDFNCDFHDNDSWWASIYTRNNYMKSGVTQEKDCTVTGTGQYGNIYNTDIYPAGGINRYTWGALFITFNVDGDPKKARAYFKNVDGQIVDSFTIFANTSVPVTTPTPTTQVTATKTPTPTQPANSTPTPTRAATNTPTQIPTSVPTATYLQGDINRDGVVNLQDYVLLSNAFGTNNSAADINADGIVNLQDYVILSNNFGRTGPTPGPVSATPPPVSSGQTYNVTEDSFVSAQNTSTINGNNAVLVVADFDANTRSAYLKFNVGTGSLNSAELKLTAESSNNNVVKNVYTSSSSWSESTLNYSNRPARGVQVGSLNKSVTAGETLSIPLDASKLTRDSNGNLTLIVDNTTSTSTLRFHSKESTSPSAKLVINGGGTVPTFSPTPTNTASTTATPRPTNTNSPTPTAPLATPPPITSGSGIWISQSQIMALPTTGTAWNNLSNWANQSIGTPTIENQDSDQDQIALAKAFSCARTGTHCSELISALNQITTTPLIVNGKSNDRALAWGRNLAPWIISADILINSGRSAGFNVSQFRTWVYTALTTVTYEGGSVDECHENWRNNWGTMCGGSRVAAYAFLGNTSALARTWDVFRGYVGDYSAGAYKGFNTAIACTTWRCPGSCDLHWINPKSCTKDGRNFDGINPSEMYRQGEYSSSDPWPPASPSNGGTTYPFNGLGGLLVQAEILSRKGYPSWAVADSAMFRAYSWMIDEARWNINEASKQSCLPWLINKRYGRNYPKPLPATPGQNIGFCDWMYQ